MSTPKSKLIQLEGLRGVAAFVVVLGHLRRTFFLDAAGHVKTNFGEFPKRLFEACLDGEFAVWLFWVMSAFVLSLRFHETSCTATAHARLTDAAVRRYPRLLLPVVGSVLFAWLLHQLGLMTNGRLAAEFGHSYSPWLGSFYAFDPNAILALKSAVWESFFDYDRTTSYNSVLWTMEIELLGSLFLFAFLVLFGKHQSRLIFYLVTLLVIHMLSIHWLNAFTLGILLSDAYVNRAQIERSAFAPLVRLLRYAASRTWIALICMPVLMVLVGSKNKIDVQPLILAAALTGFVLVSSPAKKLFSLRPLAFLGKISFGLYLAHLPIICALAFPAYTTISGIVGSGQSARLITAFFLMVVSVVGGWVLWYAADRPAIAFSRLIARRLNKVNQGSK